jgi:peroxiredoxin
VLGETPSRFCRQCRHGSAAFTRAIGFEHDRTEIGMGIRSRRYAMVVDDGVVKFLNVEPLGEFKISSADTILALLG